MWCVFLQLEELEDRLLCYSTTQRTCTRKSNVCACVCTRPGRTGYGSSGRPHECARAVQDLQDLANPLPATFLSLVDRVTIRILSAICDAADVFGALLTSFPTPYSSLSVSFYTDS